MNTFLGYGEYYIKFIRLFVYFSKKKWKNFMYHAYGLGFDVFINSHKNSNLKISRGHQPIHIYQKVIKTDF